jgi:hypothetical protein
MPFNPKQEYLVISKDFNIEEFHKYPDDFITRPPYQRKTVWSLRKKQDLIDSLFRRYYVPKLVMREVRLNDNKSINEIVDGQQRITTAQSFFRDEFKLTDTLNDIHPEIGGKKYSELSSELRKFIDKEMKFSAEIIKNIDDPKNRKHQKIATDIFWRLQQGETLNFMEVAHAELSSLSRNVIVKYSDDISFDYETYTPIDNNPHKHNFFNLIDKDNKRMEHLKFFTRFLLIEDANGYADIRDARVIEFVNKHVEDSGIDDYSLENKKFVQNTLSNLNLIYDIFKIDPMVSNGGKIKEFGVEYFIISFYILIRHIKHYYVISESEKEAIRTFFYSFYQRWKNSEEEDTDIMAFSSNRQQSSNNLQIRDRIFRQMFFTFLIENGIDFILKDGKRAFNEAERIKLYRRDHGQCQECLAEGKNEKEATVPWNDYQADHIFPHALGGKTNINNAQLLCSYHNQSKGKSINSKHITSSSS